MSSLNTDVAVDAGSARTTGRDQAGVVAAVVVVAAALLPALVSIATRWGSSLTLVQDGALIDLRVRDILSNDTPLLGVYSQFGWNHPGPVLFWLLAPFSWIAGGRGWGLLVGTAAIQAGTIACTCWIAWRHGGPRWATFWGAVVVLSYAATGPWMLVEVWNPHLAFPLFILMLVMVWQAVVRPWSYIAWSVVIGSMLIQLHVGYLALVGGLVAMVAVRLVLAWRGGTRPDHLRRTVVGGVVGLLVLWTPPLVDALSHRGGNARRLFDYFVLRSGTESTAGLSALKVAATQFRIPPPWAGGRQGPDPLTGLAVPASAWWLLVAVTAVIVGAALFRRSPPRVKGSLAVSWVAASMGLLSLFSVRGKLAPYVFYWQIPISILLLAAATAAVVGLLSEHHRQLIEPIAISTAAIVLLVSSAQLAVDVVDSRSQVPSMSTTTDELVKQVRSDARNGSVIIRWIGSPLGGLQAGLINELDRQGFDVRTDVGEGFQFGSSRETPSSEVESVWYASEQGFVSAVLERQPGAHVLASVTPLDPAQEQELRRLQLEAFDDLAADGDATTIAKLDSPLVVLDLERLGILDADKRHRLSELNQIAQDRGGCRCAIVAFDPEKVPTELVSSGMLQNARGAMP